MLRQSNGMHKTLMYVLYKVIAASHCMLSDSSESWQCTLRLGQHSRTGGRLRRYMSTCVRSP